MTQSASLSAPSMAKQRLVVLNSQLKDLAHEFEHAKTKSEGDRVVSMQRFWSEKARIFEAYRECLEDLPKELKSREFMKRVKSEIHEQHEIFKAKLQDYRDYSVEDWQYLLADKKIQFEDKWHELQSNLEVLQLKFNELEQDPFVQKFLRGETILSDIKNIQWARKLGHAMFGMTFLYIFVYSGWPQYVIWGITVPFVLACFALETVRHLSPQVNVWVCKTFKPVMREHEKHKINSAIFYIISLLTVYFLFPIEVTVLSLLFLALGDPVASIFGLKYGKTKLYNHVSLQGSLACFAMCFMIGFVYAGFVFTNALSGFSLILFSVFTGIAGAVAESLFPKLDDNLVIPIVSAPILLILMLIFGVL